VSPVARCTRDRNDSNHPSVCTFIEDMDRARGLDIGADGYLTHPVEPKVLVSSINALLRARNAESVRHASDAKLRAVFDLGANWYRRWPPTERFVTSIQPSVR
jgi:DNA-binding response OmpR family regulator